MKKVYISADTEGLNGITSFKQVLPEFTADYAQMQPQLHFELNALLKGLKAANVEHITVNDAHNTMTNITLSLLPSDVELISGKPKKVSMMYGLNNSYDGVIFFAYHAKATSDGVLAHTFNMNFKSVSLNGQKISEAILNGIYAKLVGVPIIFASGDNIFCDEIRQDLPAIETITTKTAINSTAAICRKNEDLASSYILAGKNITNFPKCEYKLSDNYELQVEFMNDSIAGKIANSTNLKQSANSLFFSSKDYIEIYTTLQKISAATTILYTNQNQQV